MDITVEITKIIDKEIKLKAVANVYFDNKLCISEVKVINGKLGLVVAMPTQRILEGYEEVAYPTTQEFRNSIESAVIAEYKKLLESQNNE